MTELRFEAVTVRYGTHRNGTTAVDRVDLTVPSGSTVGLVGESGSGKSTLARAAVGVVPVQSGQILLDGAPTRHGGGRHRVQMVFQDPYSSLDPRMTIGETIAEALSPEIPRSERRHRVETLLRQVNVDPSRASSYPGHMSGGQRQRVALARALASEPEVLIADEITAALDVSIQGAVLNLVRDLQQDLGLSMLYISHNLAVVRYVATHIAVMYLGQIVEFGTRDSILRNPQHPYTRDLLASIPAPIGEEPIPWAGRTDSEPPTTGCPYYPRCPIGPTVHPERTICITDEPTSAHLNMARCHFAQAPTPTAPA